MHQETSESWEIVKLKLCTQLQLSFLVAVHLWKQIHVPFLKLLCSNVISRGILITQFFTTRATCMHGPMKNSFILLMSCHSFCCLSFSGYLYRVCARVWYRLSTGSYHQNQSCQWERDRMAGIFKSNVWFWLHKRKSRLCCWDLGL